MEIPSTDVKKYMESRLAESHNFQNSESVALRFVDLTIRMKALASSIMILSNLIYF